MPKQFVSPAIGSRIAVTTDWSDSLPARLNGTTRCVYTGTVIPNAAWEEKNCFTLRTGKSGYPVSTIYLPHVVDLRYLDRDEQIAMIDVAVVEEKIDQQWQVEGSKGDNYIVTLRNGQFSCTCPGFGFRRKCKHIDTAKELAKL